MINSPEPTHGKHLPEIVVVITQYNVVLKLCPSLLIVYCQMKGLKLSLASSLAPHIRICFVVTFTTAVACYNMLQTFLFAN